MNELSNTGLILEVFEYIRAATVRSPPPIMGLLDHQDPPPARCRLLSAHPSARATTQPTYVLACFFFVFFFIREIVNLYEHSKKSWNIGDNGMTNIVVGMILQSKF